LPGEVDSADVFFEFHFKGSNIVEVGDKDTRNRVFLKEPVSTANWITEIPSILECSQTPLARNEEIIALWICSYNDWLNKSVLGNGPSETGNFIGVKLPALAIRRN
jgi:hypothetical protein